jgi:NAD(P)-dependent dehydrogenase (short-subunit alcohol dehydrogenase family)
MDGEGCFCASIHRHPSKRGWYIGPTVQAYQHRDRVDLVDTNISSGTALNGGQNYIHYVTSKGALIAMTRAMAKEVGDYNICVNTVSPGFVVTEGRAVDPAFNASRVASRAIKRVQVENDLVGTVLFAVLSWTNPDTAQLFGAMIRQGPEILASLPVERQAQVHAEFVSAFRAAFLVIAGFAATGVVLAWTIPARRLS